MIFFLPLLALFIIPIVTLSNKNKKTSENPQCIICECKDRCSGDHTIAGEFCNHANEELAITQCHEHCMSKGQADEFCMRKCKEKVMDFVKAHVWNVN